jgi:PAS domain S-box-containing protein
MVSLASAPLTQIGFRRDVKLFLGGLVGFLVLLVFLLLLFLRTSLAQTEEAIDRSRRIVANIAADAVNQAGPARESLDAQLAFLRGRFNIPSIVLDLRGGGRLVSGTNDGDFDDVTRLTGVGLMHVRFDANERRAPRRHYILTALICVAAASLGIALLLFYLPRIIAPIEKMLEDAKALGERDAGQDETAYLIDTFRSSIATLKSQEEELKRLHELEKTRADDLERVTAALTRSLTSGLIAVDSAGNVVDVNHAGREILGIDAHEAVAGRPVAEVIALPGFAGALQRAFAQQTALTRVEVDDVRAGEAVTIGLTTVPLRNDGGDFLGFLALFTDLTPIRSLEARVQELATLAQLGELSAGIAHELRNSVTTILGYMKLARRGDAESRLQSAEKEASLLLQAIERLLAFARPVKLNAERVELRELVREQVRQIEEIAPGIAIDVEGPPIEIDGDRVLLARAVENLLRNAVDAVREKSGGGAVRVTLAAEPAPSITIADNGGGFDPAETARLFLPFHSNKPSGFGMGLPLAKKIVLLHGGTLRLHGEPGRGAVATMEFAAPAER